MSRLTHGKQAGRQACPESDSVDCNGNGIDSSSGSGSGSCECRIARDEASPLPCRGLRREFTRRVSHPRDNGVVCQRAKFDPTQFRALVKLGSSHSEIDAPRTVLVTRSSVIVAARRILLPFLPLSLSLSLSLSLGRSILSRPLA